MRSILAIYLFLFFLFVIPGVNALTVVSTTTALWDPAQRIGGEKVRVIYIADPTICPHMQADIIPNRIQMQKDFIRTADLFIAHNGTVDKSYVMPYVDDFMAANKYGTVKWVTLKNPSMTWNTPDGAKALSREVAGWLIAADPANKDYYEARLNEYLEQIDAADLTPVEKTLIGGQVAVVMVWQQDAAETWLGLHVASIYGPDFYQGGKFTPVKIVDDINNNTEKYRNVLYVIENMQSGELAKGLEEALHHKGISAKRVIFTNFPKSVPGVESLPDVLRHNKNLVMPSPQEPAATITVQGTSLPIATTVAPTKASMDILMLPLALGAGILLCGRTRP